MDENGDGGINWTQLIMGANDAALQWYSTVTQKPIAREQPTSIMGILTGTDYGRTGPTGSYASPIGGGIIMIAAIVVIVVLVAKK